MQRKEIMGSRFKTSLYLVFCLAAVALSIFVGDTEDERGIWWGIFFSVCALVFIWLLIRPQRLLLDPDGFSIAGGFWRTPRKVAWRDVSSFFVVHVRYRTTMIGYNFNPEAANKPLGLPLARSAFGADGALHGVWTLSNARMADELNTYRSNALKAAVF